METELLDGAEAAPVEERLTAGASGAGDVVEPVGTGAMLAAAVEFRVADLALEPETTGAEPGGRGTEATAGRGAGAGADRCTGACTVVEA